MNDNKKEISLIQKILSGKNKFYVLCALLILAVIAVIIVFINLPENIENNTETTLNDTVLAWIEEEESPAIITTEEIEEIIETTDYINQTEPETETGVLTTEEPVTEEITITIATEKPIPEGPIKTLVIYVEPTTEPPTQPPETADNTETVEIIEIEKVRIENDGIEKFIALSFDDGPSAYTEHLMEILEENNCKATFFVMGYKVASYSQLLKRMVDHGSQVAGHTWNHPQLTRISSQSIIDELQPTHNAIFEVTGIYPTIYRAPYGSFNENVKNVSADLGLALIQWNIDPNDWRVRNADIVYNNIMKSVKDGCIICVHDTHGTTVQAMERVIPDLIEAGYNLLTISELLGETEPGRVYYSR